MSDDSITIIFFAEQFGQLNKVGGFFHSSHKTPHIKLFT